VHLPAADLARDQPGSLHDAARVTAQPHQQHPDPAVAQGVRRQVVAHQRRERDLHLGAGAVGPPRAARSSAPVVVTTSPCRSAKPASQRPSRSGGTLTQRPHPPRGAWGRRSSGHATAAPAPPGSGPPASVGP
jgi:hypothetical protein